MGTRIRNLSAAAVTVTLVATASPPAHAATEEGYRRQSLSWSTCAGVDDPDLRCGAVRVPLDYRDPDGRAITVTISRLAATDPAHRRGVLLTTGGGPGGAGVPLPSQLRGTLDPGVLARYDIVGFDIRFLQRSTPISCGQPAEEPGAFWVQVAGLQSFATTVTQAATLARDCIRTAGWALPYATTANVARDMDVIRAALGESRISYLGGSYAGLVGVTYRTLFPSRVDRLVVDSPPDLDTVWRRYELDRTAAMEDNYQAFLGWLAAADGTYRLGGSPAQVGTTLTAALRRAPILAGGHAWASGELGYLLVLATFFQQLWPVVAVDVATILAGGAPPVPLPVEPATLPGTPADNQTAVNLAFRCGDNAWPRSLAVYRSELSLYSGLYPTYGPANANVNPCAFWPVSRDNTSPLSANRPGGALILAALHDAAVPVANSLATHAAIPGSRLVTVDLRVHTPLLSGQAPACMTGAVTAYLVDGALPDADVAC